MTNTDDINLLDPEVEGSAEVGPDGAPPAPPPLPRKPRPQGLPDKFWDDEKGEIRVGSLWRSYLALEQRLGRKGAGVPATPDDYCLDCGERHVDPAVNAVLHKAGFTNDQAQLVYDLAAHYVVPELESRDRGAKAAAVKGRLEEYFGGPERWQRIARQLSDWGKAHLPEDVMDAMGTSFEGVLALHRMMAADEPNVANREGAGNGTLDEKALRKLMQDPRYWRDQDPAVVSQVREGFERLYPG